MERVGDDGEDGECVDEADRNQRVCVVHLHTNVSYRYKYMYNKNYKHN